MPAELCKKSVDQQNIVQSHLFINKVSSNKLSYSVQPIQPEIIRLCGCLEQYLPADTLTKQVLVTLGNSRQHPIYSVQTPNLLTNQDLIGLLQVLINTDKYGKPLPRILSTTNGKYCSKSSDIKTPFKAVKNSELDGIKQKFLPEDSDHERFVRKVRIRLFEETPIPMKLMLYENAVPIVEKAYKSYAQILGSNHPITREAKMHLQLIKKTKNILASL
ncbi:DgyrCDS435 [Dimorphilus gyrociliatus]|uniref:DgyrCDS435 n=1 Tax=Dimorphilus gyrociliatus TaxID=2664684 RepID=A0A7I8V4N9_9ANNE|nr:DgyrCDS435 [Dimorphilus gyrociliatus]